ncbi:MAG TPA: hypothetical protein ENI57_07650 [Ignavibacteria bacterium]|nr:hypothetical protein [Ignavibacteria bacterium]
MKSNKVIIFTILVVFIFTITLYILSSINYISNVAAYSGFLAILFTTINYALGMLAIKVGIDQKHLIFMVSVFGGMLIRLILLILLVFIALEFLDISRNIFIFLVLFFYILYLISEIFYLVLRDKKTQEN